MSSSNIGACTSFLTMATASTDNVYETDESLQMYLGLHYPSSLDRISAHDFAPNQEALGFSQRVAQLLIKLSFNHGSALDVGCAVGGTAFELAKTFQHVDAFDFSEKFIATAERIQEGHCVKFPVQIEGELYKEAVVSDVSHEDRIKFFTGDACKLVESVPSKTQYDAVVLANLLCRIPDPDACLQGLSQIVKKGGVVLMVTPFTWLEEYTPREKWIGGKNGTRGIFVLHERMDALGFEKIHDEEMPLLIREHQRKYQWIVSKATGWKKK
jgi:putative 4-mercaptohistidine N1-methyltranferase